MARNISSLRAQALWAVSFCLVLQFAVFAVAKQVIHVAWGELVGPYFAFALPTIIFVPSFMWLRRLEYHATSPRRLALYWGVTTGSSLVMWIVAFVYSGLELHLINPNNTWAFVVAGGVGIVVESSVVYRNMYRTLLTRMSARTPDKR